MRITKTEAMGKMHNASEMLQHWHESAVFRNQEIPNFNDHNFQIGQVLLSRLVDDVQLDHRLVIRIADDPVESLRTKELSSFYLPGPSRLLKPWTLLQLTEAEEIAFPHGRELYLGTKSVKIAASSIARILHSQENALQIMREEQAKGIAARFTKF